MKVTINLYLLFFYLLISVVKSNFVANNINFDKKFLHLEIQNRIYNNEYITICTMQENKEFLGTKKGAIYNLKN